VTAIIMPLASVGIGHFTEDDTSYRISVGMHGQAIADMPPVRRLNAALTLLAMAGPQARAFEVYAHWDGRPVPTISDPVAWMVGTALFRALVAGLPRKRAAMIVLDDRARHTSDCPAAASGACGCEQRSATDRAVLAIVMAAAGAVRV
jgi:hypothetical protein